MAGMVVQISQRALASSRAARPRDHHNQNTTPSPPPSAPTATFAHAIVCSPPPSVPRLEPLFIISLIFLSRLLQS
eukprot:3155035-Pyramimonas_sp.AAC.1